MIDQVNSLILGYVLVAVLLYSILGTVYAARTGYEMPQWMRRDILRACILWPWLLMGPRPPKGDSK